MLSPINPYGHSKVMVEQVLQDISKAGNFNYVALRYFNVAGADPGVRIGEGKDDATHLITMCVRTALGLRDELNIYGTDYPTPDGTCIRDYIHVDDLADAHILSLEHLIAGGKSKVFNCGYNRGYSVLEVVDAAKRITGVNFQIKYVGRRPGDPPALVADSSRIKHDLNWKPKHDNIDYLVETAWQWEKAKSTLRGQSKF